jgi:hypothetical protein
MTAHETIGQDGSRDECRPGGGPYIITLGILSALFLAAGIVIGKWLL